MAGHLASFFFCFFFKYKMCTKSKHGISEITLDPLKGLHVHYFYNTSVAMPAFKQLPYHIPCSYRDKETRTTIKTNQE